MSPLPSPLPSFPSLPRIQLALVILFRAAGSAEFRWRFPALWAEVRRRRAAEARFAGMSQAALTAELAAWTQRYAALTDAVDDEEKQASEVDGAASLGAAGNASCPLPEASTRLDGSQPDAGSSGGRAHNARRFSAAANAVIGGMAFAGKRPWRPWRPGGPTHQDHYLHGPAAAAAAASVATVAEEAAAALRNATNGNDRPHIITAKAAGSVAVVAARMARRNRRHSTGGAPFSDLCSPATDGAPVARLTVPDVQPPQPTSSFLMNAVAGGLLSFPAAAGAPSVASSGRIGPQPLPSRAPIPRSSIQITPRTSQMNTEATRSVAFVQHATLSEAAAAAFVGLEDASDDDRVSSAASLAALSSCSSSEASVNTGRSAGSDCAGGAHDHSRTGTMSSARDANAGTTEPSVARFGGMRLNTSAAARRRRLSLEEVFAEDGDFEFGWISAPPDCVSACGLLLRCCGRHPAQKAGFLIRARAKDAAASRASQARTLAQRATVGGDSSGGVGDVSRPPTRAAAAGPQRIAETTAAQTRFAPPPLIAVEFVSSPSESHTGGGATTSAAPAAAVDSAASDVPTAASLVDADTSPDSDVRSARDVSGLLDAVALALWHTWDSWCTGTFERNSGHSSPSYYDTLPKTVDNFSLSSPQTTAATGLSLGASRAVHSMSSEDADAAATSISNGSSGVVKQMEFDPSPSPLRQPRRCCMNAPPLPSRTRSDAYADPGNPARRCGCYGWYPCTLQTCAAYAAGFTYVGWCLVYLTLFGVYQVGLPFRVQVPCSANATLQISRPGKCRVRTRRGSSYWHGLTRKHSPSSCCRSVGLLHSCIQARTMQHTRSRSRCAAHALLAAEHRPPRCHLVGGGLASLGAIPALDPTHRPARCRPHRQGHLRRTLRSCHDRWRRRVI
jgi:hypothetical protein